MMYKCRGQDQLASSSVCAPSRRMDLKTEAPVVGSDTSTMMNTAGPHEGGVGSRGIGRRAVGREAWGHGTESEEVAQMRKRQRAPNEWEHALVPCKTWPGSCTRPRLPAPLTCPLQAEVKCG